MLVKLLLKKHFNTKLGFTCVVTAIDECQVMKIEPVDKEIMKFYPCDVYSNIANVDDWKCKREMEGGVRNADTSISCHFDCV